MLNLNIGRSTWSFIVIALFGISSAIFIIDRANSATDEIERLNSGPLKAYRAALAEQLNYGTTSKVFDISNWKTYHNEKYGFEVKYPVTWELVEKHDEEIKGARFDITSPAGSIIVVTPTGLGYGDNGFPTPHIKAVTSKIGGIPARVIIYLPQDDRELGRSINFFQLPKNWKKNNAILTYIDFPNLKTECAIKITQEHPTCEAGDGILYSGGNQNEEDLALIDQILSTFKFNK